METFFKHAETVVSSKKELKPNTVCFCRKTEHDGMFFDHCSNPTVKCFILLILLCCRITRKCNVLNGK